MYLVEVEFFSWYQIPDNIKAEYIKGNCAIFRVKDRYELQLFIEEARERKSIKRINIYYN